MQTLQFTSRQLNFCRFYMVGASKDRRHAVENVALAAWHPASPQLRPNTHTCKHVHIYIYMHIYLIVHLCVGVSSVFSSRAWPGVCNNLIARIISFPNIPALKTMC